MEKGEKSAVLLAFIAEASPSNGNGKYRSRQRYLYKDCGRTFNDMKANPISGSHYPHRWLHYFKLMLKGIIESDKGKRQITHRKPRKRGGVARKRGISNEQFSVIVAHNRSGNSLFKVAGRGRITADEIDLALSGCLDSDVVLCTDSATNYKLFAKKKEIPHEILNGNKGVRVKKGIYHIQHVNAYHQRLKKWMERFNGIVTHYIDNYLVSLLRVTKTDE